MGNAHELIPGISIRAPLFRPGVHHTGSSSSVLPSFAGDGSPGVTGDPEYRADLLTVWRIWVEVLNATRDIQDPVFLPTDEMFAELRKYWNEEQIVEIVGVISLFGFLNRWNDTMATPLEDEPIEVAEKYLTAGGWQIGKHHR